MARRATAIAQEREKADNVLLLDAGNTLFGQSLADKTRGRVVIEAMNKLGYNAMALGNTDLVRSLDLTQSLDMVRDRGAEAKFPLLSANVTTRNSDQLVGKPYTIVTVDGRKIGIIGLTQLMTSYPSDQQSSLVQKDYLTAARDAIEQIKQEGGTAVIVLSNLGETQEKKLAEEVPGIAVIVGGGAGPRLPEPTIIGQTGTVILRTGGNGEDLGVCQLTIDSKGQPKDVQGQLVTLRKDDFAEDADMLQLLDSFKSE